MSYAQSHQNTSSQPVSRARQDAIDFTDSIALILGQPNIIIRCRHSSLFFPSLKLAKYEITDSQDNIIGYIEEDEKTSKFLKSITPGKASFLVRVLDINRQHLLTIERIHTVAYTHITISLPSMVGNPRIVGESKERFSFTKEKFSLYLDSGCEEKNEFGSLVHSSWKTLTGNSGKSIWRTVYQMEDFQSKVMGLLDYRIVFKNDREYNLAMDSRQLKYNPNPPKNISNNILTLDQRAVLLGTVIAIDFIILETPNTSSSSTYNNNANAIGIANGTR